MAKLKFIFNKEADGTPHQLAGHGITDHMVKEAFDNAVEDGQAKRRCPIS